MVDLLAGCEKAAVNAVELRPHTLVMLQRGGDEIGEVAHNELSVARVGGEHRRRYGTDLYAHRRKHGDDNGQRASPETRDIMDRRDPFRHCHTKPQTLSD